MFHFQYCALSLASGLVSYVKERTKERLKKVDKYKWEIKVMNDSKCALIDYTILANHSLLVISHYHSRVCWKTYFLRELILDVMSVTRRYMQGILNLETT